MKILDFSVASPCNAITRHCEQLYREANQECIFSAKYRAELSGISG